MTRLHAPSLAALATRAGEAWELKSPAPGQFYPAVGHGDLVLAGHAIGELDVLGRRIALVAPDVQGIATNTATAGAGAPGVALDPFAPRPVGYGDLLLALDTRAQLAGAASATATAATATTDVLVFRAPTSGRFYVRPAPGKPAFVEVGTELAAGTTVCLLEVMKTFNRVTYGGAGLPERARVKALLVSDGADVTVGEPLLALE
ncbi:MAG TPA: biotin/lipoyl-containing protein [Kofleriaceae bacterium]|jgi:biotin carboxyl carrier protein|nr:biotin/lipoyl-containing protein [Kofleriaceae bacterium]